MHWMNELTAMLLKFFGPSSLWFNHFITPIIFMFSSNTCRFWNVRELVPLFDRRTQVVDWSNHGSGGRFWYAQLSTASVCCSTFRLRTYTQVPLLIICVFICNLPMLVRLPFVLGFRYEIDKQFLAAPVKSAVDKFQLLPEFLKVKSIFK